MRRGRRKRSAARRRRRGKSSTPLLGATDIVITATGAAAPILTKAHIEAVMRPRRNRPLFIIDIAMPRDVEPAAGEIEQVFLYNIDDLQATVRENLARRASEVARAEAIVGEEVDKFGVLAALARRDPDGRRAAPALRGRPPRASSSRLAADAAARSARRVDDITRLIVEKLLLTPTEQLKSLGDAETVGAYSEALTRLFGLTPQPRRRRRAEPEPRRAERRRSSVAIVASSRSSDRRSADIASADRASTNDDHAAIPLRLGTRGSQLALWQAHTVAARCSREAGGPPCEIVIIKTSGDRLQDAPLSEVGGKRLFVKEIEDALLDDEIDLAVHSSKDMPAVLPDGLAIAGVLPREDPHDAVVLAQGPEQGSGAEQGSGSSTNRLIERCARCSDRHRRSARAACGGRAADAAVSAGARSRRSAATSTRGCASSTPATTTRWCWRRPASGGSDFSRASRSRCRRTLCVPAPGQGIVAIEIRDGDDAVAARGVGDQRRRRPGRRSPPSARWSKRSAAAARRRSARWPRRMARTIWSLSRRSSSLDGSRAVCASARGARPRRRGTRRARRRDSFSPTAPARSSTKRGADRKATLVQPLRLQTDSRFV